MCSFAKFLALGLIASEGHGPVFAQASLTEAGYKNIVGIAPETTANTDQLRMEAACREMNEAHKQFSPNGGDLKNWSKVTGATAGAKKCSSAQFTEFKQEMLKVWEIEAAALNLSTPSGGGWKLDSAADHFSKTNIKAEITQRLKHNFISVSGSHNVPHSANTPYYTQIRVLRDGITDATKTRDAIFFQGIEVAKNAKLIAEKALQNNSNMALRQEAEWTRDAAKKILDDIPAKSSYAEAEELLKQATALETNAKEILAQITEETVGGFFGVFLGLVGLALAFLMSPCVQFNWNTGKTYKNWGTGEVDSDWKQMDMYKPYGDAKDKTPEDHRNEVRHFLGMEPEKKVDSAKASSSALTVAPVLVLACGVCVIARRGLNKRRAQKKAKRASRAQEKMYEEL